MGIIALQSNSTHITLSFSLFFKIILMTCLSPFFGSGRFGQLGLAATSELLGNTGDGFILCCLVYISDDPVLGSLAQDHFKHLTRLISPHRARTFLDASKNPPLHLILFPRLFFLMQQSADMELQFSLFCVLLEKIIIIIVFSLLRSRNCYFNDCFAILCFLCITL
jgi:hypothetical protein